MALAKKSFKVHGTTYTIHDDVSVLTETCTDTGIHRQFSIGKIIDISESEVCVQWYYKGYSKTIHNTSEFQALHPTFIPLHRILLYSHIQDNIHPQFIYNHVYVAKEPNEFKEYQLKHFPYNFYCKYHDKGDNILHHMIPKNDECYGSDAKDDETLYVPSSSSNTAKYRNDYSDGRTSRIKFRRAHKITISLLSSSDDDNTHSTSTHTSKMQSKSKPKPPAKPRARTHSKTSKKKSAKNKHMDKKHSTKKKLRRTDYDALLKTDIKHNINYARACKRSLEQSGFPYPCKPSDHQKSPSNLLLYMFYVLHTYFNYDGNVEDVTPYKCPQDCCDNTLWTNEPLSKVIFVNPPWSVPYYYISESVKYIQTTDLNWLRGTDTSIAVLVLYGATNTKYWKHLVAPYNTLKMDLGHVKFGNHQKWQPYPCSLIFITTGSKKRDPFMLSQMGLCDLQEWSEQTKLNKKMWRLLEDKLENNFTVYGDCYNDLSCLNESDFE
eukprot:45739_1